jgi:hypothetical protein
LATAVHGASSVRPAGHAVQLSHARSDCAVALRLMNCCAVQTVSTWHSRSVRAVGAFRSNSDDRHSVRGMHCRSLVPDGAWNSNWVPVHCVTFEHVRSDELVPAADSNSSSGTHTVYSLQTRSAVRVAARDSNSP